MRRHGILVVGDINTDILAVLRGPLAAGSDTPAEIHVTGGGSAANTAAWLAAVGTPVTLAGAVGADPAGEARLAELAAAGVRLAVRRIPGAGTGTVVVLSADHDRSMLTDRGANRLLTPSDVDHALATVDAVHVHVSAYPLLDEPSRPAGLHALAAALASGRTASVDAASAAPLRRAPDFLDRVRGIDLLVANADEARVLAGSAEPAALVEKAGVAAAVVKLGGDGAAYADRAGETTRVDAAKVTVVDATGAGDAFAAGFLSAWLAGAGPEGALRAGVELGARAVGRAGARPEVTRRL
jgi:ribokinase